MAVIYKYQHDVARAKLPMNLKKEFNELFQKNIHIAQSKTRHTSSALSVKTQRLRSLCMVAAVEDIYVKGNFQISSLNNLREKHIEFIINYWV